MLFVEERTFVLNLGNIPWASTWESAPLAGASAALRAAVAIVSCRLSYRDGDHKVLRVSFAAETYIVPATEGVGPRVGVRYAAMLRDNSYLASWFEGQIVHSSSQGFWEATGTEERVDDAVVGSLQVLMFATDDPAIAITQGISNGAAVLTVPSSSPGAAAPPAETTIPGGNGVRALLLSGARVEFVGGDHHVHKISAQLSGTSLPQAYRVAGRALIKGWNLNDIHQGKLFFTLLELPSSHFQVTEGEIGLSYAGAAPEAVPQPAGLPPATVRAVALRGFSSEFTNAEHYVRTLSVGLVRGFPAPGEDVSGAAGISHQDHWREPYMGNVQFTAIQGDVGPLSAFSPHKVQQRIRFRKPLRPLGR